MAATADEATAILPYPIPHDGVSTLHVYGNPKDATHLVICCGGFPDDHGGFVSLATQLATAQLKSKHGTTGGCLVGIMCLPGYETYQTDPPSPELCSDGYTMSEWVVCMREAIKALRKFSSAASTSSLPLTAFFHDWGAILGVQYLNQALAMDDAISKELAPDQVVLLDVMLGLYPDVEKTFLSRVNNQDQELVKKLYQHGGCNEVFPFAIYQWLYFIVFFLNRFVAQKLALFVQSMGSLILFKLGLFPMDYDTKQDVRHLKNLGLSMASYRYRCYPYWHMCKSLLSRNFDSVFQDANLPKDLVKTPILFIYGSGKTFQLHNKHAAAFIEYSNYQTSQQQPPSNSASRVVCFDGVGHYLQAHHADECFQEIKSFLGQIYL